MNARVTNTPNQSIVQPTTAHIQRTISNAAVLVYNGTPNVDTTHVLVQFNGADVRVTFDGTAPTASLGFLYTNGSSAYWTRRFLVGAKAIRTAGTDAVAEIQELNSAS